MNSFSTHRVAASIAGSVLCHVVSLLLFEGAAHGAEGFIQKPEDRVRIEQALPQEALAKPRKARRLLIFTLNVGYPGHTSMAYANEAFTLMGKKTGAFDTEISNDPQVFERDNLRKFDAVFFNNTVGNCFTNADLRRNLVEFILGGGGLMGVHGTTVAFTQWPGAIEDWPEFGYLIGARGANHKDSNEHVWMKIEDPIHPITKVLGDSFEFRDEFFRPQGTYSRERVRVLLSIDTAKTDVNKGQPRGDCLRADNDYAVAWIRNYGRGRVFYCTIAHNPYVFWDPKMLQFYLAAAQFALGDLRCSAVPSAQINADVAAQEKIGWRLLIQEQPRHSLAESSLMKAKHLVPYLSAAGGQFIGKDSKSRLGPGLSDSELAQARLQCELSGIRLASYVVDETPSGEQQWRELFEFGRKMGLETLLFNSPVPPGEKLDDLCSQYGTVAACRLAAGNELSPQNTTKTPGVRASGSGILLDLNEWGLGAKTVKICRTLKERCVAVRLPRSRFDSTALRDVLKAIYSSGAKPIFLVDADNPGTAETMNVFNETCRQLAESPGR